MRGKVWSGCVGVVVACLVASSARGQSQLIHGNAAEVGFAPAWQAVSHRPYGLEGYLLQNQSTFVSLPLATSLDGAKALYRVKVLFYAAPDVHVTKFQLWDGGTEVKSKFGSWTGNLTVYLKTPLNYQVQHGLSLCLTLASGSSATLGDRRFVLNSGGADYKIMIASVAD